MSPWSIAWRNLRSRGVQTLLTAVIIALGIGLALAVVVLGAGVRRGLVTAGGPFEIVVGPKGSATQLVMSSVLLQDLPLGNLTYAQYQTLRSDQRVRDAIPIALGDNVGGLRIVGTTPEFFGITVTPEHPPFYRPAAGRVFSADWEAVLGSAAAAQLGLGVGSEFASGHGLGTGVVGEQHTAHYYKVVGILASTHTPADRGIYVSLSSYWNIHHPLNATIFDPPEQLAHELAAVPPTEQNELGVTAVLVRAKTLTAAYQLYQTLNTGTAAQAALPGVVLTQFLDVLGQGQRVLLAITYVALGMAALSVALSLYALVQARRRELAVLRALGAGRRIVFAVVLCEVLLLGLLGVVLGLVLGHGLAAVLANVIAQQSAVTVSISVELVEAPLLLLMLGLGLVAGLLPALQAYRIEPARVLAGV